jgi:hypothetical protein
MTIWKMKPRGNVKISYDPTFQSFFHQVTSKPRPALFPLLKSRDEISFKGEGYNTSSYELTKYIIKILINNRIKWIINLHANQK